MGDFKMKKPSFELSRRDFIAFSSGVAASTLIGTPSKSFANSKKSQKPSRKSRTTKPNILFVFTDQERYFSSLPNGFDLPGHNWLAQRGTEFTAHTISSCMCTSSRSVMLTGLQTIDNGMFENTDLPWVKDLSPQIQTVGHMLRKAGYYTAYKGKWHLNRNFENPQGNIDLNVEMEKYGFADFHSPGDKVAHALGGFNADHIIAGNSISWLRTQGSALAQQGSPWGLFVSLINPHDIMYFNADAPGENVQDTGKLLSTPVRAPHHSAYSAEWNYPLPSSLHQSVQEKGRPQAHAEFHKAWGHVLGHIPLKDANWNRFTNFYLNSIRFVDMQLALIFNELESLGLADNTIVVFTADHGEMAGSHGLRGKGPFAYKESLHVPFYVVHPDFQGGQACASITSHIDIVPSILSMAGVSDPGTVAGRQLPGKDFSTVLASPQTAGIHDVRDKSLFTYSGLSTNDSELIRIIADAKANGQDPKEVLKASGYKPNLKNRGTMRTVFDGRYKMTRYFSPVERHSPKDLTELFAYNDVELFDLQTDPQEMTNLATLANPPKALIETMFAKLEDAIREEMGVDDGREMPPFAGIDWALDHMDL
jgi:arylsulfatase A-like enzyme